LTMKILGRGPFAAAVGLMAVVLIEGCSAQSEPSPGSQAKTGAAATLNPGGAGRGGVAGVAYTEVLIGLMQGDLDSFGGWRPNDLLWGKIFENRTNEELGHLAVVRESVEILKEDLGRRGALDDFNPDLAKAEAAFNSDPSKLWPPSAESRIKEGIAGLKSYREQLISGETRFLPRPENFSHLLDHYVTLLGELDHRLVAPAGFFKSDNEYYYCHGAATGLAQIYAALQRDFAPEIQGRGVQKLMDEAQASLEAAAKMHPWIVLDGGSDSFRANHRLNMAAHLAEARTKSFLVLDSLKQPQP
jgi:hypothetical protein